MIVRFACPQCGKKLSAPVDVIGKQRACPQCGTSVMIPDIAAAKTGTASAAPPPPPPPPVAAKREETPLMRPAAPPPEDLIDVTAMVDIVFFMLIFFLVTSLQSLEAVIQLPTPQSDSGTTATIVPTDVTNDPDTIMVTIDESDQVWVEDEEVFGEQNLRTKLRAARADGDRNGMLVVGDPEATHGKLVMVLDAGADAGLTELMFAVDEEAE
jgi:biopolymer transport protein ExbD